jgi:DNA-binding response OmpR family regulator
MTITIKKRVLAIEEDTTLLKILQSSLLGKQVEFLLAIDPDEGISKAVEEKPDLLILDAVTREKSGPEVLRAIRSNAATKNIPVFVLATIDDVKVKEEMVKLGVADYIVKGTVPLREVVQRIIGAMERSENARL